MKKLLFFWKELLATFWFIPVLLIILAVILSIGLVTLDGYVEIPKDSWFRFFIVENVESARSILVTISGAMIGVAGTVFSVTLVALTLASTQFGPRLIKRFMYVRLNQVVLGSYISTYLYCLLILNTVKEAGSYTYIPSISILVAILFASLNIILLIIFIHRIAVSIQADRVVSDIAEFMSNQTETLFPEKIGTETDKKEENITINEQVYAIKTPVKSNRSGYLQYISSDSLVSFLKEHNAILVLDYRPGKYVVNKQQIGTLYTKTSIEEKTNDQVLNEFVIGKLKTSQQDLEYSIHQMVEIASRAISPGINDPYTAITCIDYLSATLCYLAQAKFPSKYRYDEKNELRIVADTINFEGILDTSFNQIRQFSSNIPSVTIKLMEALTTILSFTVNEKQKKAVIKHAIMVLNNGRNNFSEENDIKALESRAEKIFHQST